MRTPYSKFTSLIVVVAALALIGGIAIVLVTSRDSLELAPEIWFGGEATAAAAITQPPSATPTEPPAEPTATEPAAPTATNTLLPSPTLEPTFTATPASSLPAGVTAIAEVAFEGTAARLRDAPNGRVVGALLRGTRVEVLLGRELVEGITWVEVRAETGETGWMSEGLLDIVAVPDLPPPATAEPSQDATALPTLPGGVQGTAVVALSSGTAARLRDAPGGRVIGGLLDGAPLKVLQGHEVADGLTWIEVQDENGLIGWISEDLVVYTSTSSS